MPFVISKQGLGWIFAIVLPMFCYIIGHKQHVDWAVINFLVVFSSALMMWAFRLASEYIPALFIILAVVILGLVPTDVVLCGYISSSFFMTLSIFALGSVIVQSRIFYRFSLFLLKHIPHRIFLLQVAVYIFSIFITPIMTVQSSRISLLVPMLNDLVEATQLKKQAKAVNGLAMAAFAGTIFFSMIFMTGKSSNLVLYSMMPEDLKQQFTWMYWLKAALVPGIFIFIVGLLQIKFSFDSHERIDIPKDWISKKIKDLGPMKHIEWTTLTVVLIMGLAFTFSSKLNLQPAWFSFGLLIALMTIDVVNNENFRKDINWSFLFYLGGMVGIMQSFQYLQIDAWILNHLQWLLVIIKDNSLLFILVSYLFAFFASFIFGTAAAPSLSYTILAPVAEHIRFNSWLLIFILLMATESWLFPYQSSYYLCFEDLTKRNQLVNHKHILKQNAIFVVFRLLIIFASIWYWKKLGIL